MTLSAPPAELFLKNMRALWRADHWLAHRVDAVADEDRLAIQPTRSGAWTAAVPAAHGRPCYLHSRYDPEAEAEKLLVDLDFDNNYCFVVSGFGLGYHIRAMYEKLKGDAIIVAIEPSVESLATALSCVDLADVIDSGKLIVLLRPNKATFHERLKPHNALIMLGAQFVAHPPSQQIAGEFHAAARKLFTEFVTYTRVALITLVSNAQITCRNIANNLPTYVATPPIDILRGRFAGCPAIVVSAGPSLRKNIHLLDETKGRIIIIATQTTYKVLRQRGVIPDFVVSLDYHEKSRQFFEGIEPSGDVHLVAEPKATWHVIDEFRGPVSLLSNPFARLLLGDELAARDGLPPGATVAHLAFYLARYAGCSPIIFVGQDLAYTGYVYYVPGVEMHDTWRSEINRFNTMEMKEWERLVRAREALRKVKDAQGRELYTDDLLFTYLEQFEKDFAGCPAKLINATEGGACIRGTESMTLRAALDRYGQHPIPAERFAYRRNMQWYDRTRHQPARNELASRLDEVRAVGDICDEMSKLLEELQGLTDRPDQFNRRLTRVDELRTVLRSSDRAYQIITSASQMAELRRFTADRQLRVAAGKTEGERALKQLKRDMEFVKSVREGVDMVTAMLRGALDRFDRVLAEDTRT
ncbi:MAG: motility associated factor glycosyltransferase family protein [Phycisphaerales bacterium]|nr:MAG: motility associated factor glycosyltransferase family protein [Phycisphaerales bacterium]